MDNDTELIAPSSATTPRRHSDASLFVRIVMRPMTMVLNPLIRRLAGRRHFGMAAQIHHRGRRSGRELVTPASARPSPDGSFLIPLTFGEHSDWCRNVLAAGYCTVRFKGTSHLLASPSLVGRDVARSTFRVHERMMFRVLGITKFLRLEPVGV